MTQLSNIEINAVIDIAAKLQIANHQWLIDLINFETGGTFSPIAANPNSSAKGLIQFLDATARSLGYSSSQDLVDQNRDFISQLRGPVYEYLKTYGPYPSEYQLYMAVFYPVARSYEPDTTFKEIYKDRYPTNWQGKYAKFESANPGIDTPQTYVNMVKKNAGILVSSPKSLTGLLILLGAAGVFWLLKQKR